MDPEADGDTAEVTVILGVRLLAHIQLYITEYGKFHSSLNLCKAQERAVKITVVLIAELSFESYHSSLRTTGPRVKGLPVICKIT
jgi:hypothetical protein